MVRVFFFAILAFAAGYLSRPLLSPYIEGLIYEYLPSAGGTDPEPEPIPESTPLPQEPDEPYPTHNYTLTGYLTESGFNDDGLAPPGEGPYQLFDVCNPVTVELTLSSAPGDALVLNYSGGEDIFLPGAGIGYRLTAGAADPARTIVSLGQLTRSTAGATGVTFGSQNNSIDQYAEVEDAWGYVELIEMLSISSSTATLSGGATFEALADFLATADRVSGNFELPYCDTSMLPASEVPCSERPRGGIDHPFQTTLSFTPVCDMR